MKAGKSIALAILFFGPLLYVAVYFMAAHSEAFVFAENTIKHSQSLQTQIGNIKQVKLPLFGSYEDRFVNREAWATMEVEVTGALKTVNLELKMKKKNGAWIIEQALLNGNPVTLN